MRITRRFGALLAVGAALTAMLGVASPPASAAGTVQLRFVTANLNFGLAQSTVQQDWHDVIAPNADIAFLQEAKNVNLDAVIDNGTWLVQQDTTSSATKGSALVIRKSVITDHTDWGLVKGVDASSCPDGGIETRWIAKMQIQLSNGRWIRVASLHLPPARCQTGPGSPYDLMSDNVVGFVADSNRLTVLGADWNKVVDDDPNDIGKRSGLEPNGTDDGSRIDGFMYSAPLANCCLTPLAVTHSDHRPVQIKLTVPAP